MYVLYQPRARADLIRKVGPFKGAFLSIDPMLKPPILGLWGELWKVFLELVSNFTEERTNSGLIFRPSKYIHIVRLPLL
jgi:hypothetical protein